MNCSSSAAPAHRNRQAAREGAAGRSGAGSEVDREGIERILKATAEDTPCPSPPALVYPDPDLEGLTNTCEGTRERNGLYGFGVVDAMSAVIRL